MFWLARIDHKRNPLYKIIVALFLLSSISSVYLVNYDIAFAGKAVSFGPIVFHIVCLFLFIYPISNYDRYREEQFQPSNAKLISSFTWFTVIVFVVYFINTIQNVSIQSIFINAIDVRSNLHDNSFAFENKSFLGYVGAFEHQLKWAPLALSFYYIKFSPQKKTLIYLLLFCSLIDPISYLMYASRDYIIRYIFVFCIAWLLMSKNIHGEWNRKLGVLGVGVGLFFTLIFIVITIGRFSYGTDSSPIESMISYLGQGFANFPERMLNFPNGLFPSQKGGMFFPLLVGDSISVYNLNENILTDIDLNTFTTVIGSFLEDCGAVYTVVIICVYSFLFYQVGKFRIFNVFSLFFMLVVIEIVFTGIFFYSETITFPKVVIFSIMLLLYKLSNTNIK